MTLNLVTFADSRMLPSLNRLKKQASYFNEISDVFAYTEADLSSIFITANKDRLTHRSRGFGYWAWKPEVVLMAFEQINFGDVVCYCDAGFHLNKKASISISRYTAPIYNGETDIVSFSHNPQHLTFHCDPMILPNFTESRYNKGDMLEYWKVKNISKFVDTPQYASGLFFMKKTESNLQLLINWKNASINHPSLFDDSPSISANLVDFIEHRHDQAYFSLMCKANHHIAFSAFEFWFPRGPNFDPDWGIIKDYPFLAKRDKSFVGLRRYWQPIFRWGLRIAKKVNIIGANNQ